MASSTAVTYDGRSARDLAGLLGLPRVLVYGEVGSTMDVAHGLAGEGAMAGTLVLADAQRAGRGRAGRRWVSRAGTGLWLTLIERPNDLLALDVLSLRVGLCVARALDRFAPVTVGVQWPNDLLLHDGKVAGILVETRWRDGRPDWVALGIGVNRAAPAEVERAASLGSGTDRVEILTEVIPAVRAAAAARGHLTERELADFAIRDTAAGRPCLLPRPGRVAGIGSDGSLLVVSAHGVERCRDGSLVLEGDAA